jgi:hypothetical protein
MTGVRGGLERRDAPGMAAAGSPGPPPHHAFLEKPPLVLPSRRYGHVIGVRVTDSGKRNAPLAFRT